MIGVSVIICCYNSALRLPETIRHIANQTDLKDVRWEVIVVNNASLDSTASVASAEFLKYGSRIPSFRIVEEPVQGLTYARMRGILEACYEYIVFCDDDNWLDAHYIRRAVDVMNAHPEVGIIGGQSTGYSDIEFPDWFDVEKHNYAVGKQGLSSGDITSRYYLWGSGMVLRKSVFVEIQKSGIRSQLTDRKGSALSSGGDSEICVWFILWDYKLWYEEELRFVHFISKERLTEEYLRKLKKGLLDSWDVLKQYFRILDYRRQKHFGLFDPLYGLYLVCLLVIHRAYGKRANKEYMRDMIQLYTRSVLKYNKMLYEVTAKLPKDRVYSCDGVGV